MTRRISEAKRATNSRAAFYPVIRPRRYFRGPDFSREKIPRRGIKKRKKNRGAVKCRKSGSEREEQRVTGHLIGGQPRKKRILLIKTRLGEEVKTAQLFVQSEGGD